MQLLSIEQPVTIGAARRARLANPDELQMDRQTFRDLEIFEAEGGAASVFDLLNYTRTTGGAKVLQTRLRRPFASVTRIRAVQESLRFISEHGPTFDWFPGEVLVSPVEQYLNSGLPTVATASWIESFLEAMEIRFGETIDYRRILGRMRQTAGLIRALRRFIERPELRDAPGDLGSLLTELADLVHAPRFSELPEEGSTEPWFWQTMRLDRLLRTDERVVVDRMMRVVAEIDALIGMSEASRRLQFAVPEVVDGPLEISADGVYHPFLSSAIPNPLRLDRDVRLLFLTGPNMAGKTTYLRACGIAIYLAHLGVGVPARSFRFSPCDSLFTAIALVDNVREGVSFFRAEALRVKSIAQALADGRRVIGLLDEPFMGTNVKDAYDASRAVLTRLVNREDGAYVVSSHLMELGEGLQETGYVQCSRFEATEDGGRLAFDYKLRPGISSQRLGVRVLQEEGVFDLLDQPGSKS